MSKSKSESRTKRPLPDRDTEAFPLAGHDQFDAHGMRLRDYFAAQALIGLIINGESVSVHCPITERAYELADLMMQRRDQ